MARSIRNTIIPELAGFFLDFFISVQRPALSGAGRQSWNYHKTLRRGSECFQRLVFRIVNFEYRQQLGDLQ
jgi:hypothetical protein